MDPSQILSALLAIAVIQTVGWATPGPNHLAIITASVTSGRAAGLRAAAGIAAGAFTWSLVTVSGIAVLFELFPPIYIALRGVGAGYLIWLGIGAFRAARRGGVFKLTPDRASPVTTRPFRTAYVVMITNPKAVLFFGSILTAFIPPEAPGWLLAFIPVQVGALGMILNTIAALFFSSPPVMHAFQRASFATSILFGILFTGLGLLVAWELLGHVA